MKTAMFEYKCRRCGALFYGPCTGAERAEFVLIQFMVTGNSGPGVPLSWHSTHYCGDKPGCGIGDLIGYIVTED